MQPGTLFVVATPIGNLNDITNRALETLRSVDIVLCEDTRVTQKLLAAYDISVKTMSYHHHSGDRRMREIATLLEEGKMMALVTDAGTPGISDPGNLLIQYLTKSAPDVPILPIPGPSAVTAALSISGFRTDKFLFLGFPPHKKGRQTFFADIARSEHTVVFYESSHRIQKAIDELAKLVDPNRRVCLCRELTKKFESVYRGCMNDLLEQMIPAKGEFVFVLEGSAV